MMRLVIVAAMASILLGGCGSRPESSGSVNLGLLPTSPARVSDDTAASLSEKIIHRAREFRGNPWPLGILTGAVLLVALGLGVYTVGVAYRHPAGR
jgi:hypothetical protein